MCDYNTNPSTSSKRSKRQTPILNSNSAFSIRHSMLGVERWTFALFYIPMTIFLGCGFAAKYREGGGNFSVPLLWMLGLKRLKLDAIWLELLLLTDVLATEMQGMINTNRNLKTDW